MYKPALWVQHDKREVRVNLKDEFDGLHSFEHIHDSMPPVAGVDRIILDFSQTSRVKPIELHYLLTDLSDDPCFDNIEICIQGLRFNHMDMECPNGGRGRLAVQSDIGS